MSNHEVSPCYNLIRVGKSMTDNNRFEMLKEIKDEIVNLKSSPLYDFRKKNNYYPVIGEGNHFAKVVFIGEAPGGNEAKTGRPFYGQAGKILDRLLDGINLQRSEVYITNIVKDRPPGNRDPSPQEISLYSPFLLRQLEIIRPKIIATLGRFSMKFILDLFSSENSIKSITQLHGTIISSKTTWGETKIMPLLHPAVVLYNPQKLEILKKDFQNLKNLQSS